MSPEMPKTPFEALVEEYPHLFGTFTPEQLAQKGYEFTLSAFREEADGRAVSNIVETLFPGALLERVTPLIGKAVWVQRSVGTWQHAIAILLCEEGRSVEVEWSNPNVEGGKQSKRVASTDLLRWQIEAAVLFDPSKR